MSEQWKIFVQIQVFGNFIIAQTVFVLLIDL